MAADCRFASICWTNAAWVVCICANVCAIAGSAWSNMAWRLEFTRTFKPRAPLACWMFWAHTFCYHNLKPKPLFTSQLNILINQSEGFIGVILSNEAHIWTPPWQETTTPYANNPHRMWHASLSFSEALALSVFMIQSLILSHRPIGYCFICTMFNVLCSTHFC